MTRQPDAFFTVDSALAQWVFAEHAWIDDAPSGHHVVNPLVALASSRASMMSRRDGKLRSCSICWCPGHGSSLLLATWIRVISGLVGQTTKLRPGPACLGKAEQPIPVGDPISFCIAAVH